MISATQDFPQAAPEGGIEIFVPTPRGIDAAFEQVRVLPNHVEFKERIADYDRDRIHTMLKSVEGQHELVDLLVSQQDTLQEVGVNIDPTVLQSQIEMVGATLEDMEQYDELVREAEGLAQETGEAAKEAEESPGMFRRALNAVGGFAKKHPIVTTLLVTALAAAGVAAGFYFTGNWELLMTSVGLDKWIGGAGAAGELIPPTPTTPPLPGGGVFEIPPPTSPPGSIPGIDTPV